MELSEFPPEESAGKKWEIIAHKSNAYDNGDLESYSDEFIERVTPLWHKVFATVGNTLIVGLVIYFLVSLIAILLEF